MFDVVIGGRISSSVLIFRELDCVIFDSLSSESIEKNQKLEDL